MTQEMREEISDRLHALLSDRERAALLEENIYQGARERLDGGDNLPFFENVYFCKAQEVLRALEQGVPYSTDMGMMSTQDLRPDRWEDLKQRRRAMRLKTDNLATDDSHTCPKCQKNKATITQVQTRSADEAATTYIKCMECGYTVTM